MNTPNDNLYSVPSYLPRIVSNSPANKSEALDFTIYAGTLSYPTPPSYDSRSYNRLIVVAMYTVSDLFLQVSSLEDSGHFFEILAEYPSACG